ncbi:MAG: phosphoribosylamine--glycine ligase, partial [Myxococcales bacterium]|nr:phosphoribosylamine--glycine ligase [Myxococcales bacterium]
EYNVRFGDPECQALMALWEDDPVPWLLGAARGMLPNGTPRFAEGSACCVVLASAGYPESPRKGVPIPVGEEPEGVVVFHAGTAIDAQGQLVTAGGRVLGITGRGADLEEARQRAYAALPSWAFEGEQHRTDIGGGAR